MKTPFKVQHSNNIAPAIRIHAKQNIQRMADTWYGVHGCPAHYEAPPTSLEKPFFAVCEPWDSHADTTVNGPHPTTVDQWKIQNPLMIKPFIVCISNNFPIRNKHDIEMKQSLQAAATLG
ncbi:MAG TPA: hypothetical protein PLG97_02715 [Alcaligenes sp.]|nr:hypothetical protein [Alcaligenes sp.]HRL26408.1 hypothetical protein [Alcaligenes sp.]